MQFVRFFNRLLLVPIFSVCFLLNGIAQQVNLFEWQVKPEYSQISEANTKENVVVLIDNQQFRYYYDNESILCQQHLVHKKFRINSGSSINEYNKLYIPLTNVKQIIDLKARSIKPDGSVIEFDENNIKEIKDEDSGGEYKIFAIDGIEEGGEVEYLYHCEMETDYFGRVYLQDDYPVENAKFELVTPLNLHFTLKGYNGFPEVATLSDSVKKTNTQSIVLTDIPALTGEKYAYQNPARMRVDFRLDQNDFRGKFQILTWDDAAQRVYESMYLLEKNETKIIQKMLASFRFTNETDEEKVRKIENFLKTNFVYQPIEAPYYRDLALIEKNRTASTKGMVKVYVNLLKALNIKHQIVLTTERDKVKFDPDFQSWNYLDEYLIFIPGIEKYLSPSNMEYRLGIVTPELTANYGLFIELVKIADFESAIAKIHFIEPLAYDLNYDNHYVDLTIDIENGTTLVSTERCFNGLNGQPLAIYYPMMDESKKQEFLKSVSGDDNKTEYKKLEVRTHSVKDSTIHPDFIIYSEIEQPDYIEFAGNKVLVKLGECIGPQAEMYQEEERKFDIENVYNRRYSRDLTVKVPSGYRIANPDVANMQVIYKEGESKIYGFESAFTYNGDVYRVIIDEYYKEITCSKEHYEDFRRVVNAAADFNKVVLVLELVE